MNYQEVVAIIEPIIAQSLDGQDIENIKIECKSQWWDLKSISGLNEFLKDTCAIVNTFGLDGFIIIGYNDKAKSFDDAMFSDSGCKDNLEIRNILIKHVDTVFDINTFDITLEGHKLSILHIPPSVEKPHVLKVYKKEDKGHVKEEFNKIFIRKNSSNHIASKTDIDIMYYDRKNVIPDYKLIVSISKQSLTITGFGKTGAYDTMKINPVITFENQGSRPVAIVGIEVKFSEYTDPNPNEIYTFALENKEPILIPVNQIINCRPSMDATFDTPRSIDNAMQISRNLKNVIVTNIRLTTNTGKVISEPVLSF